MSLKICFIEGQKNSICNNDALSVVVNDKSIDIIPVAELKGHKEDTVRQAFAAALKSVKGNDDNARTQQRQVARKLLDIEY